VSFARQQGRVSTSTAKAQFLTSPGAGTPPNTMPVSPASSSHSGQIQRAGSGRKKEHFVGVLRVGGPKVVFGELGLLSDETRSATVRTEEGCELLVVSKENFDEKIKERYNVFVNQKVSVLKVSGASYTHGGLSKGSLSHTCCLQTFPLLADISETHARKLCLHMHSRNFGPQHGMGCPSCHCAPSPLTPSFSSYQQDWQCSDEHILPRQGNCRYLCSRHGRLTGDQRPQPQSPAKRQPKDRRTKERY